MKFERPRRPKRRNFLTLWFILLIIIIALIWYLATLETGVKS